MAEKGLIFNGMVRDISLEGYGVIDTPDGGVVFCLGVYPTEEGRFEIIKKKGRYGYARLLELKVAAKERIEPPCPHSGMGPGLCGGCPWMSLDYQSQLQFKAKRLHHNLVRLGLASKDEVPKIRPAKKLSGYRNRAQFKTDGNQLGFVSRFSRSIAPIKDCIILDSKLRDMLNQLLSQLPEPKWKPNGTYPWSYLEVDEDSDLASLQPNLRRPFKQANTDQNTEMKSWLLEKIEELPPQSNFLELFCGSGNFTEILLKKKFTKLAGVDIASDGLSQLESQKLIGLEIIKANLFKPSDWKLVKEKIPKIDFLLLDPPREGFEKLAMFAQQFGLPEKIYYVSCDMATFVRDAWLLKKKGYELTEIEGIDQFPHTPHLEILAVLELN